MALHEQSVGATDEWYTPARVFEALDLRFNLDPCPAVWVFGQKLPPAYHWCDSKNWVADGLEITWYGRVWMNPPFGPRNGIVRWLERFMAHANGIALTPDRTSAPWWQRFAPQADALLFVSPKLRFIGADGREGVSPAQGTTLMACGQACVDALQRAEATGLGTVFRRP